MKEVFALICFIGFVPSIGAAGFNQDHTDWGWVLKTYQAPDGRVNYGKLQKDLKAGNAKTFELYLSQLGAATDSEYQAWDETSRLAFLINAYNAFTVKLVVDNYPVKSIRKIGGRFSNPWKIKFFTLLGEKIKTLEAIEHEYLRKQFNFPEMHAAINCASVSCPKLQHEPFTGKKVVLQLEAAFRDFVSDNSRNRYEAAKGIVNLSEIFKWFGGDFDSKYGGFLKAIEKLGPPEAKKAIGAGGKIKWIDYDWDLNDAKPEK